jgi:hypothetical protein
MIVLNAEATKRLGDELRSLFDSAPADFSRARELAPFLGVHLLEEGSCPHGFLDSGCPGGIG